MGKAVLDKWHEILLFILYNSHFGEHMSTLYLNNSFFSFLHPAFFFLFF